MFNKIIDIVEDNVTTNSKVLYFILKNELIINPKNNK